MASSSDAEIILKLYELRTESTMRAARNFVGSFHPESFDELAALQRDVGSENNAYWRQVLSYWEMAAAFILHDALDADLFLDTNGENLFYYAKFTPFLEQWRSAFGQPFMKNTAKLIESYPRMQERYTMTLARMEAQRKQTAPR